MHVISWKAVRTNHLPSLSTCGSHLLVLSSRDETALVLVVQTCLMDKNVQHLIPKFAMLTLSVHYGSLKQQLI